MSTTVGVSEKALESATAIFWIVAIAVVLLGTAGLVAFCGWVYPLIRFWLMEGSAGI